MIKELIGVSTARGHHVHHGTTQSMVTTTSYQDPDEQEAAESLGNVISGITPMSDPGGLVAMAASATGALTQLLSNPELGNSLSSLASIQSSIPHKSQSLSVPVSHPSAHAPEELSPPTHDPIHSQCASTSLAQCATSLVF